LFQYSSRSSSYCFFRGAPLDSELFSHPLGFSFLSLLLLFSLWLLPPLGRFRVPHICDRFFGMFYKARRSSFDEFSLFGSALFLVNLAQIFFFFDPPPPRYDPLRSGSELPFPGPRPAGDFSFRRFTTDSLLKMSFPPPYSFFSAAVSRSTPPGRRPGFSESFSEKEFWTISLPRALFRFD